MSAILDSHTRSIRNIQIVRQDLFPLVAESNRDKHLLSATINAFGATIQDLFDGSDEGADFCIFSSWLAVLADRKVSENDEKNVGTFGDHVMQAVHPHILIQCLKENSQLTNQCPSGTKEGILARTRWAMPLCSGSPPHSVLGSVNFSKNEFKSHVTILTPFSTSPMTDASVDALPNLFLAYCAIDHADSGPAD